MLEQLGIHEMVEICEADLKKEYRNDFIKELDVQATVFPDTELLKKWGKINVYGAGLRCPLYWKEHRTRESFSAPYLEEVLAQLRDTMLKDIPLESSEAPKLFKLSTHRQLMEYVQKVRGPVLDSTTVHIGKNLTVYSQGVRELLTSKLAVAIRNDKYHFISIRNAVTASPERCRMEGADQRFLRNLLAFMYPMDRDLETHFLYASDSIGVLQLYNYQFESNLLRRRGTTAIEEIKKFLFRLIKSFPPEQEQEENRLKYPGCSYCYYRRECESKVAGGKNAG